MLTLHLMLTIEANTDEDSASTLGDHFRDLVWKEARDVMQLPATVATAYAERS